jgi:prepilin-type processing-associated H-X9-DG protein
MVAPRLDANRSSTPIVWDITAGSGGAFIMHEGKSANIAFVDGSSIQFHQVEYLQNRLVSTSGDGMGHPSILPALRQFRETGTLP